MTAESNLTSTSPKNNASYHTSPQSLLCEKSNLDLFNLVAILKLNIPIHDMRDKSIYFAEVIVEIFLFKSMNHTVNYKILHKCKKALIWGMVVD